MSDIFWLTDEQMARLAPFFPKLTVVEWSMYSMMSFMLGSSFSGQSCSIWTRPAQTCRLTPPDLSVAMLNIP